MNSDSVSLDFVSLDTGNAAAAGCRWEPPRTLCSRRVVDKRPFDFFFSRFARGRRRSRGSRNGPVKRRRPSLVGRSARARLQRCSVRADHRYSSNRTMYRSRGELRPHHAVRRRTRFTIARDAFGIVGRTEGGRSRASASARPSSDRPRRRTAPERSASRVARARDRTRREQPPVAPTTAARGDLPAPRPPRAVRDARDTLGTIARPRDAARGPPRTHAASAAARAGSAARERAVSGRHRGGHDGCGRPANSRRARSTVARSEIDMGTPMVLFGEEHQPAIFHWEGIGNVGKKTENRPQRFCEPSPNATLGPVEQLRDRLDEYSNAVTVGSFERRRSTRASTLTRADRHARCVNAPLRHTACEARARVRTPPRASGPSSDRPPPAARDARGDARSPLPRARSTVRFRTARARRGDRPARAFAREHRARRASADPSRSSPTQNTRNPGRRPREKHPQAPRTRFFATERPRDGRIRAMPARGLPPSRRRRPPRRPPHDGRREAHRAACTLRDGFHARRRTPSTTRWTTPGSPLTARCTTSRTGSSATPAAPSRCVQYAGRDMTDAFRAYHSPTARRRRRSGGLRRRAGDVRRGGGRRGGRRRRTDGSEEPAESHVEAFRALAKGLESDFHGLLALLQTLREPQLLFASAVYCVVGEGHSTGVHMLGAVCWASSGSRRCSSGTTPGTAPSRTTTRRISSSAWSLGTCATASASRGGRRRTTCTTARATRWSATRTSSTCPCSR